MHHYHSWPNPRSPIHKSAAASVIEARACGRTRRRGQPCGPWRRSGEGVSLLSLPSSSPSPSFALIPSIYLSHSLFLCLNFPSLPTFPYISLSRPSYTFLSVSPPVAYFISPSASPLLFISISLSSPLFYLALALSPYFCYYLSLFLPLPTSMSLLFIP